MKLNNLFLVGFSRFFACRVCSDYASFWGSARDPFLEVYIILIWNNRYLFIPLPFVLLSILLCISTVLDNWIMVVYCTLVNYSCIACHVLNSSCRGTTFSVEYINHQSSKSTVAMKSLLEVTASLLPNIVADQGSRSSATLCWVLHKHFSVFILQGAVSSDFAQNGVKRDGNDPFSFIQWQL